MLDFVANKTGRMGRLGHPPQTALTNRTCKEARVAHDILPLPGIAPVLPRRPVDRGKLLLARTRELIEMRRKVRELEHECAEIIASLHEGQA